MKKQILNVILTVVVGLVISGGFSAMAQSGSTDESSPRRVTTRTVTATVSRDLGDYETVYYSIAAEKGTMTVNFAATPQDGMNITFSIEGSGVNQSIGPFASGGDEELRDSVTFKNPRRQTLRFAVTYSGSARYRIRFSGAAITLPGR